MCLARRGRRAHLSLISNRIGRMWIWSETKWLSSAGVALWCVVTLRPEGACVKLLFLCATNTMYVLDSLCSFSGSSQWYFLCTSISILWYIDLYAHFFCPFIVVRCLHMAYYVFLKWRLSTLPDVWCVDWWHFSECVAVAKCSWCHFTTEGEEVTPGYCGELNDCYLGQIGSPSPYAGKFRLHDIHLYAQI